MKKGYGRDLKQSPCILFKHVSWYLIPDVSAVVSGAKTEILVKIYRLRMFIMCWWCWWSPRLLVGMVLMFPGADGIDGRCVVGVSCLDGRWCVDVDGHRGWWRCSGSDAEDGHSCWWQRRCLHNSADEWSVEQQYHNTVTSTVDQMVQSNGNKRVSHHPTWMPSIGSRDQIILWVTKRGKEETYNDFKKLCQRDQRLI